MDKRFEFFEHTADVKFIAHGSSLEECFANAALATFQVMTDIDKVKPQTTLTIEAEGHDHKNLLYQWLEKLLQALGTQGFLLHSVNTIEIKDNHLKATVSGDLVENGYETHGEVKAITYNEMEVNENPYSVHVVVDI